MAAAAIKLVVANHYMHRQKEGERDGSGVVGLLSSTGGSIVIIPAVFVGVEANLKIYVITFGYDQRVVNWGRSLHRYFPL